MKKGVPLVLFLCLVSLILIIISKIFIDDFNSQDGKIYHQKQVVCNVTYYDSPTGFIKLSYRDLSFHVEQLCYKSRDNDPDIYPCYTFEDQLYLDKYERIMTSFWFGFTFATLASILIICIISVIIMIITKNDDTGCQPFASFINSEIKFPGLGQGQSVNI